MHLHEVVNSYFQNVINTSTENLNIDCFFSWSLDIKLKKLFLTPGNFSKVSQHSLSESI